MTNESETWINAHSIKLNRPDYRYAMDFVDWHEVITMNITQNTLDTMTLSKIAAGVFFEITFNWFTMEKCISDDEIKK